MECQICFQSKIQDADWRTSGDWQSRPGTKICCLFVPQQTDEGVFSCSYTHGFVFVPEKGWNSGYIHNCFPIVVEWSGSLFEAFYAVLSREGVELWLYSWFCVSAREGWNSGTFMYFWLDSGLWAIFIYCYINLQVFIPYWNLEQTRDKTQNMTERDLDQAKLRWPITG